MTTDADVHSTNCVAPAIDPRRVRRFRRSTKNDNPPIRTVGRLASVCDLSVASHD